MKKIKEFICNNFFNIVMAFVVILFFISFIFPMFISIGIEMWKDVLGAWGVMSKVYKCDSCERLIEVPYEVKMKEFYIGVKFDLGMVFPEDSKQKVKIHLCHDCYKGLCKIAEKVRGEQNAR